MRASSCVRAWRPTACLPVRQRAKCVDVALWGTIAAEITSIFTIRRLLKVKKFTCEDEMLLQKRARASSAPPLDV